METPKVINLDEVVVKGRKTTSESPGLFSKIGAFFKNTFSGNDTADTDKTETVNEVNDTNKTSMSAIVTTVTQAAGAIFGFLVKGKELKIEEENTKQLQLQLEATEDIELQKTLRKKLDVQITQLNAATEADRLRRIGSLATTFAVLGLVGLIVVQAFRYKREKDKPQAPIIIQ